MSATAPYFFFSLITSIVTSLVFRKHEPPVSTFTAVCGSFCLLMLSMHVMTTPEPSVFCAFVFMFRHFTVYIVSLTLLIVEYRLSSRHPLARFPGPAMAKLTKWYMVYHVLKGDRHTTLQQLHSQLGSWVRIGPNELSVNEARAVRPIYIDLSRASSYRGVPAHDDTLIMIIDRQRHARRRKPWAKAFSAKMLTQYSVTANKRADQLTLALLERKEPVDLHHWLALCLMDIIGDLGFSGGIETLAAGRDLDGWSGESRSCACRVWRRRWQQRATEFLESVVQIRWR